MEQARKRRGALIGVVAAAATAVLALAACSSSGSGSGGATSSQAGGTSSSASGATGSSVTSGGTAGLAKYQAEYQQLTNVHPAFTLPAPGRAAPTGQTVDIINCPLPICTLHGNGFAAAAKELGWTSKTISSPLTAEGFTDALQTVLQDKPNVLYTGLLAPYDSVLPVLRQIKAAGTVIVSYGGDRIYDASSPISFDDASPEVFRAFANAQITAAIVDAKGGPDVASISDKTTPGFQVIRQAQQKAVEAAGGKFGTIYITTDDIGKGVPGQVVTYLQAHQDVKYLVVPEDDVLAGVPEALKSAGLSVKIIGFGATSQSLTLVQQGTYFADTVGGGQQGAWLSVDAAARVLIGQTITKKYSTGPVAIVTKDNAAQVGDPNAWPQSVKTAFGQAWGVK